MDDAARAVAAFPGQVKSEFGVGVAGKGHALLDQPAYGLAAVFDDMAGHGLVAQAGAGIERVGQVAGGAVAGVEHRGDAALRPVAGTVGQAALADDGDLAALRETERDGEAGQAGANNGDIEVHQFITVVLLAVCRN
jgi:hypothetical protein